MKSLYKAQYTVLGVKAEQVFEYEFKWFQFWRWKTNSRLIGEITQVLEKNGATTITVSKVKQEEETDAK